MLFVAAAVLLRVILLPSLGEHAPFVTIYPAVVLAALYGGLLPGLLAVALSGLAAAYWVVPSGNLNIAKTDDWLAMGVFLINCVLIASITEAMRRAQARVLDAEFQKRQLAERKLAEEFLALSEERLHIAKDAANLGIFDYDIASGTIDWDERVRAIWGVGADLPITYDVFMSGVYPEDRAATQAAVDRALDPSGKGQYATEYRVINLADGTLRWVATSGQVSFAQGRPIRAVGTVLDITERKQAEEALRQGEERLRRAQEIAHLGSWELALLQDRLIWSDEVYRIFGLPPQEFRATYEAFLERIHPDDRAAVDAAYSDSLRESRDTYEIEHRIVRKSTGEIRFVHEKCEHFRDDAGRIVRSLGMVHDITERKRAEAALHESEANLIAAQRIARIGSWQWDVVANTAYWSDETYNIFGLAPGRLAQHRQNFLEMIHPDDKARVEQALQDGLEGVKDYDLEYRILLPDKSEKVIHSRAEVIRATDGRPLMMRGTVHDITERKRAEEALHSANERLAEADRLKDEFLAMLAHELRNPLAPIRNAVHILRKGGLPKPAAHRQKDIIDRQVTHMARLLDDLLDISRVTRGIIQIRKCPLHLADVLAHAVETVAPLIQSHHHQLHFTPIPENIRVEGDIDRLAQIVGNLLTNAAKYTEGGGQIWLDAVREQDVAVVRVRDSGMGIDREMLPHVFELFTQAHRSLDRSQGGLGIGLTMVKRLVELHGGTVEARSEGLGQGSEFIVRLPALPAFENDGECGESRQDMPQPLAEPSRRVLVVDDMRDTALSLAEVLELRGHEVHVAFDGPNAIETARTFKPEMILLDIGMPGMDGYEVARRLRAEYGHAVALVALTGYGQDQDREQAEQAGFDDHLVKPVDLKVLFELLARRPAAVTG